ncbi:MAG: guanine deaminase [bacterium]|nr:guanine deaminase [bacterium]
MHNAIRGTFLDFIGNPFLEEEDKCVRYIKDGLLVMEDGRITNFGTFADLEKKYAGCKTDHYPDSLIMPGFIDSHIHYVQTGVIASYGKELLDWLQTYVYPVEAKFGDEAFAEQTASFFLDELLRNGTTTAAVFAALQPQSVDAFFGEALKRNMRMIAGKVMMNRDAPDFLLETPRESYDGSRGLIEKWHGKGRLHYAATPRFAITCPRETLDLTGTLKEEFPDIYIHTHLSENNAEIAYTLELFPECSDYLEIYERSGLVTDRSIFAHGVHLSDSEWKRLSRAGSSIAFCPTSNLFLGSGLFNLAAATGAENAVKVGMATDVGGGTGFFLPATAGEAYKITKLRHNNLSAFQAFYLMTLGAAESLSLDESIGNFDIGKDADLVVLDTEATPIQTFRNAGLPDTVEGVSKKLFSLMFLGDDRSVEKTYIAGTPLYSR